MSPLSSELFDEITKIPCINSHSNMMSEASYLKLAPDILAYFEHAYPAADLVAAGMTDEQRQQALVMNPRRQPVEQAVVVDGVERPADVRLDQPDAGTVLEVSNDFGDGRCGRSARPIAVAGRVEPRLQEGLQNELDRRLDDPVENRRHGYASSAAAGLRHQLLDRGLRVVEPSVQQPGQTAHDVRPIEVLP